MIQHANCYDSDKYSSRGKVRGRDVRIRVEAPAEKAITVVDELVGHDRLVRACEEYLPLGMQAAELFCSEQRATFLTEVLDQSPSLPAVCFSHPAVPDGFFSQQLGDVFARVGVLDSEDLDDVAVCHKAFPFVAVFPTQLRYVLKNEP